METKTEKIALFIDGANLYATAKSLGFDIDYKRLLREFHSRGYLLRAFYYTAVIEDQEYSSIRPLIDWLDYNGYSVVTKATKEFVDQTGRRKVKGNMDIELAVDAMEIAGSIDHMVLFSGDGDFRSLVEAVQRRGVRVTVVSTISTQPPMVADELRRQADIFLDIVELQPKIGRDPAERPPAKPASRAATDTPRNSCSAGGAAAAAPARRPTTTTISRTTSEFVISRKPGAHCSETCGVRRVRQARPRLPALPSPQGIPRGLARPRAGLVQCAGCLLRSAQRAAAHRGPGAGAEGRQPDRTAVHRRLRRRSALRHARALRLCPRQLPGAAGRRAHARRCPHHQRGALRAAREQADAGRDQDLPLVSRRDHRRDAESARHRHARANLAREHAGGARPPPLGRAVRSWRVARRSARCACSRATTARATTPIPAC